MGFCHRTESDLFLFLLLGTTERVDEMATELEVVRENQETLIHQAATRSQQSVITDTQITSEGYFPNI